MRDALAEAVEIIDVVEFAEVLRVLDAEHYADFAGGFDAVEARGRFDALEPVVVASEEGVVAGEELKRFEVGVGAASADRDVENVDAGLFEGGVVVGGEIFGIA